MSSYMMTGCLILSSLAFSQDRDSEYQRTGPMEGSNWSVGAKIATALVDTIDEGVFSFGAFGDRYMGPNFSLGVSLDYWSDTFNSSVARRVEMENFIIGGNAKFQFSEFGPH